MTPTVEVQPLPIAPQDVLAFAAEKGVTDYLPGLFNLTQRTFAGRPIKVVLEEDAEIEDYEHIVFEVETGDMTVEQLMAAHNAWTQGVMDLCPPTPGLYFLLGMR